MLRTEDDLQGGVGREQAEPAEKPAWRGWMHLGVFEVSLVVGTLLILASKGSRQTSALAVYAASVSGLFGASALYHRGDWQGRARRVVRRIDHAMIFVLVAGTGTPLLLLAVRGWAGVAGLVVLWSMAGVGVVLRVWKVDGPDWAVGLPLVVMGIIGVAVVPAVWTHIGVAGGVLYLVGGALYLLGVGALVRGWDPWPSVFGYHEVFHSYVSAAAVCQYVAIALLVL